MEENKMTDEEIVKALESLEGQYISYIDNDDDKCKLLFIDNILDFIQRLQSEKEQLKSELKKELSEHEEFTKRAKAEIERLTEENVILKENPPILVGRSLGKTIRAKLLAFDKMKEQNDEFQKKVYELKLELQGQFDKGVKAGCLMSKVKEQQVKKIRRKRFLRK